MDDEKYVIFSGHGISGNNGFYTESIEDAPAEVRFKSEAKFPPKFLVWPALYEKGISLSFIGETGGPAITADVYTRKCLPKLAAFVQKHHHSEKFVFWPDLSSSHYAKKTKEWLMERRIPFVPKESNPPNVPQARPIENQWSISVSSVYEGGWEAKSRDQLARRIK